MGMSARDACVVWTRRSWAGSVVASVCLASATCSPATQHRAASPTTLTTLPTTTSSTPANEPESPRPSDTGPPTRPSVAIAGCLPAWTRESAETVALFAWPSPKRTVQVLADPSRGAAGPYAIVERFFANTHSSRGPGTPVTINGRSAWVYVGVYGQGSVRWMLPDGSQAYIRTRDIDRAGLVAIARGLRSRAAASRIPGFDLTRPAPLGLVIVGETADPVHGTSLGSACTLANGREVRVGVLYGDTVFQYGVAIDNLPLPVVAERDNAVITVYGPSAAALITAVHNATTQQWAAFLRGRPVSP
jgi:hypothetical protein